MTRGSMTFSEMGGTHQVPARKENEEQRKAKEVERKLATKKVERWAKNNSVTEEDKCKVLDVLGLTD